MGFSIDVDPFEGGYAIMLQRIRSAMLEAFVEEQTRRGLTTAALAEEMNEPEEIIRYRLNGMGSLTLRTISNMYIGMRRLPLDNFYIEGGRDRSES